MYGNPNFLSFSVVIVHIQSLNSSHTSLILQSKHVNTGISKRGGIVGRGILLDVVRYVERRGIEYDPLSSGPITLTQIKEMIEEERLTIRQGVILIIRSGLSKLVRASTPECKGLFDKNGHIGVDPTRELLEWVWGRNLAAVGGDAVVFEMIPATDKSCMTLK